MPLLILLLFPVAEILVFIKFVQIYSFLDAFLTLLFMFLLGVFVMKTQGKAVIANFQSSMSQGKLPASKILHRVVVIIGGLLLMAPGFVSDIFGILCILPGSRHLIVFYIKFMFAKGLLKATGNINFNFGNMAGGFKYYQSGPRNQHQQPERDATVIDVTPVEVSHTKKDN